MSQMGRCPPWSQAFLKPSKKALLLIPGMSFSLLLCLCRVCLSHKPRYTLPWIFLTIPFSELKQLSPKTHEISVLGETLKVIQPHHHCSFIRQILTEGLPLSWHFPGFRGWNGEQGIPSRWARDRGQHVCHECHSRWSAGMGGQEP